ncbi:recombinase family protein [Pseudomonas sp. P867]|uniref:recombinase family protein n=1 Tax=Pseudomonas sp. P867 TaxID=2816050 RepID=UPI001CA60880|nr:recombinase family protein [Pseudomonas sp. P867]MBY8968829.1 recombinase family protein [Pseudomonas sp. P867]
MIIGYARVSTEDQNLALQIIALKAAGCVEIYTDQGLSGSLSSRPGLDRAIRRLQSGGKLVVWRLDRLGRSLSHLVRLLEQLASRGVLFQSVTEHIDTTSAGGRLVFHMMAALAEFERALISERTRAGMSAARAEGKLIGRRPSLTPQQCEEAHHLILQHYFSKQEVAARFHIHPRTLERLLAQYPSASESASWRCALCNRCSEPEDTRDQNEETSVSTEHVDCSASHMTDGAAVNS